MAIILPKSYHPDFKDKKHVPFGPVEIDWSNPLAPGVGFYIFNQGRICNVVTPWVDLDVGSGLVGRYRARGGEMPFRNIAGSRIDLHIGILNNLTVLTGGTYFDAFSDKALIDINDQELLIWVDHESGIMRPGAFGSGGSFVYGPSNSIPENIYLTWGASIDQDAGGNTAKLYINGGEVANGSIGTTTWNSPNITLGRNYSIADKEAKGNTNFIYLDNKVRSKEEIAEISRNPYQILKPVKPVIYFPPIQGPPPGQTASISEQLGLIESVTANQNAVANLSETVGINESFLGALTTLVNISEALGINDDLVNQAAAVGLLSNKLGLSENTTAETAGTKVGDTTDILGILSSFTATTAAMASITETMGVVDSPDKQAIYIGQLIEQIGTNDVFNGVAAISALIQENIGLNDQLDADIKTLGELIDIYGASDQYSAQTAAQAVISAINGLSDTVTAIHNTEGAGATSEQIGFSQQLTAIASTIANTQDEIGITDTIVAAIFVSVSISDSMGIQDNFSAIIKKLSVVSDTMGLSDSFSAELAKATVNVAEQLGLLSSYLSNTSAVATLQNNLGLQATFRVFGEGLTGSISAIINLKPSISAGKKQYFYINPKIYIN